MAIEDILNDIVSEIKDVLNDEQMMQVSSSIKDVLAKYEINKKASNEERREKENTELLETFLSAKKIEGCSDKTIHYYQSSIVKLLNGLSKCIKEICTNDIRRYLAEIQEKNNLSKVTIDNLRRIFSSFFSWLEDEDYIAKSPVRRIHKVRTDTLVKEVLSDENIETKFSVMKI